MASTVSAIIDVVGVRADNSAFSDAEMLDMYNDFQQGFSRRYPIFQQETSSDATAGTSASGVPYSTFALPSTMQTPLKLYQVQSSALREVQYRPSFFDCLDAYGESTTSTEPLVWSINGTVAYLFPGLEAATTVRLFHKAHMTRLSTITGSNALVSDFEDIAKAGLISEVYSALGEIKYAQVWATKAAYLVREVVNGAIERREMARDARLVTPGTLKPI